MQAARAARRKERILASSNDRLAVVAGEVPRSREKRLVLDDEEMDPALSASIAPISAPAPNTELPREGGSTPATDDIPEVESTSASVPAIDSEKAVDTSDLLTACLDEVFEEKASSEKDEAKARKRPQRRKVPYAELEAVMSAPTPTPTADRPGTKRPAAPSGASAPAGRPASKGAVADADITDDEDDAIVADSEQKTVPSSKLQATTNASATKSMVSASGEALTGAKKERPGRARRVALRLLTRFSIAAVMPVLLGLVLGMGTLHARASTGLALSAAASSRTCTATENDPRALLERFASQKDSFSTAESGKATRAPERAAIAAVSGGASAASVVKWVLGFPLLVLLFMGRLLLVFAEKLKPKVRATSSTVGNAGTPLGTEGTSTSGAHGGGGAFASSGVVATLMGGLGGSGGGGVLGLISQAMAAWGLARELQRDLCALLTTLLGVVAVGEAVSHALSSEPILNCA